jgi:hypothetical protein
MNSTAESVFKLKNAGKCTLHFEGIIETLQTPWGFKPKEYFTFLFR